MRSIEIDTIKKVCFFDFDGTLINPKNRYCKIYNELCNENEIKPLDCNHYWDMKRAKINEYEIFKKSNASIDIIEKILEKRSKMLEDKKYLLMDTLYTGVNDFLNEVSKTYTLVLITFRKNRQNLLIQLNNLGLDNFFTKIINVNNSLHPKYINKVNGIKNEIKGPINGFYLGDTEADILCAKDLRITSVAITHGIRESKYLYSIHPDYIVNSFETLHWNQNLIKEIGI
jgi:phosphoglycolate phosphatase-like HAD superfamily hydrolase